ncbi:hypothetical protein BPAE_0012g00830 [Botrytis paeoniae]|uniref:Uncharacterized protein n=1 Tax=Botrytis paeoniae TaxID=278948 RepID=A0A4Z1G1B0_9HELO|nr:hypothetical protein BPAE_0012g00830 [Botrytis paeoniae]
MEPGSSLSRILQVSMLTTGARMGCIACQNSELSQHALFSAWCVAFPSPHLLRSAYFPYLRAKLSARNFATSEKGILRDQEFIV